MAEQIAREIVVRAEVVTQEGRTDFHLHLEPADLGSVRVHLTAVDQTVSARVTFTGGAARQLAEQQVQALRDALAGAGVALRRFEVAGGGAGWQNQGRGGQAPFQPPRPCDEPRPAGPQPATSARPAAVLVPGRVDLVA
ncbi:MAG TPA: flagellar hook-length control protein FliK [Gemmataceae bacterium]|nr:flagellar hook-length control protein FliK [Gemmataceae bacterium]